MMQTNKVLEKKIVLLHFHIYKNAGSTIEWILKKTFGKNASSVEPENNLEYLTKENIFNYLEKNPDTKSISSHQMEMMFPIHEKYRFFTIFLARHPIDRAFSIYFFKKKENDDSIGTIKANQMDLKNFIKWNLETDGYRVMKNFQTLHVTNNYFRHDANSEDLNKAKEIIKKIDFLGTVDRIDESLVLAEETLRPFYENIDLSYVKQNVNKEREDDLNKRIQKEANLIGKEIMEKLEKFNNLDLELFKECNNELDRRIEKIEKFDHKLEEFRIRCDNLEKNIGVFSKIRKIFKINY